MCNGLVSNVTNSIVIYTEDQFVTNVINGLYVFPI